MLEANSVLQRKGGQQPAAGCLVFSQGDLLHRVLCTGLPVGGATHPLEILAAGLVPGGGAVGRSSDTQGKVQPTGTRLCWLREC